MTAAAIQPPGKLGALPEDLTKAKVAFAPFLLSTPEHPLADPQPDLAYPMDHNDEAGDCVVAGVDHALQIISTLLLGGYANWTDSELLRAYQTQNPGFLDWATDGDGPNDNGMVIAQFLSWCVAQGHILAYAKIDHTNPDEVRAAIYIGLAIVTGSALQAAQQHGQVWDYVPGSPDWGGHCTVWGGYDGARDDVVSWGSGGYQMTPAFVAHRVTEAYFILTQAHIDHPAFRSHFDLPGFAQAILSITHGKVVVPVPPAPTPTPIPPPAPPAPPAAKDRTKTFTAEDASLLDTWAAARHVAQNKAAAAAWRRGR